MGRPMVLTEWDFDPDDYEDEVYSCDDNYEPRGYSCNDRMCGAADCLTCHPEGEWVEDEED